MVKFSLHSLCLAWISLYVLEVKAWAYNYIALSFDNGPRTIVSFTSRTLLFFEVDSNDLYIYYYLWLVNDFFLD